MEPNLHYDINDRDIEILPPASFRASGKSTRICACCGQSALMDEDCYGMCDECLSPSFPPAGRQFFDASN